MIGKLCPQSLISFLLLSGFLFINTVSAASCFEPSPSRKSESSLTAELPVISLDKTQLGKARNLFNYMEGQWSGIATETVCKGTIESIREEKTVYDINMDIELNSKFELQVKTLLESAKERKSRQEMLQFFLVKDKFRVDDKFPAGDVQLLQVSQNFISFLNKEVFRTRAGGVSVREIIRTVSGSDNQLSFEFLVFSNGVLSSRGIWQAQRKR